MSWQAMALQSLSSIFGLDISTLESRLQAAYSHDWSDDPFSRGAYSYGGVGAGPAVQLLSRPVANTLLPGRRGGRRRGPERHRAGGAPQWLLGSGAPAETAGGVPAALSSKLSSRPNHIRVLSHGIDLPAPHRHFGAQRPLVKRYAGVVRLTHWLNAVFLVGMVASGLQIYNAYAHFGPRGIGCPAQSAGRSADTGMGPAGRLAGRWTQLAFPAGLALRHHRAGVSRVSGDSANGAPWSFGPRDIGPALQMQLYYLRLRKEHPPQGKHNALQKAAYTFIVALGAISALSGFAIYKPVQLGWLTRSVRRIRAGPLLALRRGLALRRIYPASRRAGAPGRSRLTPGDDHRLVSGKVSQP